MKGKNSALWGSVIAIGVSILLVVVLLLFLAENPFNVMGQVFSAPFGNRLYLGNWLSDAALLSLTGLGIALAFGSGVFNLGGEGQTYSGGLVAFLLAYFFMDYTGFFTPWIALLGAFFFGGFLAGLSGYLKEKIGVDELLSSFLISAGILPLVSFLITHAPLRDPMAKLQVTYPLDPAILFDKIIPASNLNWGSLLVLPVILIFGVLWFYTPMGYKMRLMGQNPRFAQYTGMSSTKYRILPMFFSGGLHALAGAFAILGIHGLAVQDFSAGLGWNGISVALIARNNPALIIPSALILAYLGQVGMHRALPFELGFLIQGIVLLFITVDFFQGRRKDL